VVRRSLVASKVSCTMVEVVDQVGRWIHSQDPDTEHSTWDSERQVGVWFGQAVAGP
jgi:hypothetical protein